MFHFLFEIKSNPFSLIDWFLLVQPWILFLLFFLIAIKEPTRIVLLCSLCVDAYCASVNMVVFTFKLCSDFDLEMKRAAIYFAKLSSFNQLWMLFLLLLSSCIAALLGARVILTDLPDRLRLLKKNVETNFQHDNVRGSAIVKELIWGDDLMPEFVDPLPDYGNFPPLLLPTMW